MHGLSGWRSFRHPATLVQTATQRCAGPKGCTPGGAAAAQVLAKVLELGPNLDGLQEVLDPVLQEWRANPRPATQCLSGLARAGRSQAAISLLQALEEADVETNAFHYGATINACEKASQWRMAVQLLGRMSAKQVVANVVVYGAAISACEKGGEWTAALKLLHDMFEASVETNTISCTAAVSACEKAAEWVAALQLLHTMSVSTVERNVFTFNAAISACEKAARWDTALALLASMADTRVQADRISYNAAISACEKGERWAAALTLFGDMPEAFVDANDISFNAAISSCAKSAQWQPALDLLWSMATRSVAAGIISYSATISACEKASRWELSLELLEQMDKASLAADPTACNAVISSCAKCSQWAAAMAVLRTMEKRYLESDVIGYSSALIACERCGDWELAMSTVEQMQALSIQSNLITRNAVVGACEKGGQQWAQTLELLAQIVESKVDYRPAEKHLYVHGFHAGCPADCLKHVVLVMLLQRMSRDSAPFTFVDTHAGAGLYDLHSEEAQRNREFETGIHLVQQNGERGKQHHHAIQLYLDSLKSFNAKAMSAEGLRFYFGSPTLAQMWLRPQDEAIVFETSSTVFQQLKRNLQMFATGAEARCKPLQKDSFEWWMQQVSEQSRRRTLVLIDPPYDSISSSVCWIAYVIRHVLTVRPSSCVALWYPSHDDALTSSLRHRLSDMHVGPVLIAELSLKRRPQAAKGWSTGMLLVNPPIGLDAELQELLPEMGAILCEGDDEGVSSLVQWTSVS